MKSLSLPPRGEVINLPNNSCPIDFAYRIHTDVGNRAMGAKVNGQMVPLDYKLKTGEIVEIVTSNANKGPSIHWLSIVQSNQAKVKIRAWFKKEKREENIAKGKELLEKEAKRQDRNFADIARGIPLHKMIEKYHGHSIEDLFAVVGAGQISPSMIVSYFKAEADEKERKEKPVSMHDEIVTAEKIIEQSKKKAEERKKKKSKSFFGVKVTGMDNVEVRFSKCCNPLPGDDIKAYITNFRGISVHRTDCPNFISLLQTEDPSRFVQVEWQSQSEELYSARLMIIARDRGNLITDVMMVMSDLKISINGMNAESKNDGNSQISISMLISSSSLLNEVIKRLRKIPSVQDVYRIGNA